MSTRIKSKQCHDFWQSITPYIVFCGLFTLILRKIADSDIWYHLSIGREVFLTKKIPAFEFLVFPNTGDIAELHEWGYGLFMFLVQKIFGIRGLGLVNAVIGTSLLFILYRLSKSRTQTYTPSLFTLAFILVMVDLRLSYRPEMILFLALSTTIYCLENYSNERNKRWLIILPVIALLLAQFHPSVLILLLVWACYVVQFLWDDRNNLKKLRQTILTHTIAIVTTLGFSLINPYGLEQLLKPVKFSSLNSNILQFIGEFKPILETDIAFLFIGLIICGTIVLLFVQRLRIAYILLFLGFGFLTYRYNRNLALLGIVMFIPISLGLTEIQLRLEKLHYSFKCILPLLFLGLFSTIVYMSAHNEERGLGILENRFPAKLVKIIKENKPEGNLFNQYDIGGYLGWKLGDRYQVFVDGRQYKINRAWKLYNAVLQGQTGWQYILQRYNVNTIIIPTTYIGTGLLIPFVDIVLRSDNWIPVAQDYRNFLFVRKEKVLANNFSPLDSSVVWQRALEDSGEVLKTRPADLNVWFNYGYINEMLHRFPEARSAYIKVLMEQPNRQDVKKRLDSLPNKPK